MLCTELRFSKEVRALVENVHTLLLRSGKISPQSHTLIIITLCHSNSINFWSKVSQELLG